MGTTVNVDLRQFSGEEPGVEADNGSIWFWPYRPYHVEDGGDDYLVSREVVKIRTVDGIAAPVLPETPLTEAVWVQLRGVKGTGEPWLIQIPATECNLFDLAHIDPDTLDPLTPPTPYWLEYMDTAIADAIDGILDGAPTAMDTLAELADALGDDPNFATTVITALAGKVDTATYDAAVAAINTAIGLKADTSTLTAHTGNTSNPHSVTKAQVGLGSADNTSDGDKPVSTAQAAADTAATTAAQATSAQRASNLSDLANAATARTNLGLGTAATQASGAFDAAGAATAAQAAAIQRANHTGTQLAATISDFNTAADARVVAGITGKQPLDADLTAIAALAPADTQQLAWSTTLGTWTVANPTGAAVLASATNSTTVVTSISAAGGVGTAVVVPGTSITVPNSGGRSVTLKLAGGFAQSTVGLGSVWLMIWEGAAFLFAAIVDIPNSTAPALNTITIPPHELDIGAVTTSRTFHLQALLYAPSANNPAGAIVNSANTPTSLKAIAS